MCRHHVKSRKRVEKTNGKSTPIPIPTPTPRERWGQRKKSVQCSGFQCSGFRKRNAGDREKEFYRRRGRGRYRYPEDTEGRVCGYVGVGDKEVGDREREVFRVSVFRFQVSGKALAQKCWGQGQRILSASGSGSVSVSGRHGKRVCGYVGVGGGES